MHEGDLVIVLGEMKDASAVQQQDLRALALRRLEMLAAEDLLGGDTPSSVVIIETGDPASALSGHLGFDVLATRYSSCRFNEEGYARTFEALEEHPSFFEIVFVLSDYGDGVIVLVPKQSGIDADLLAMCALYAVPSQEPSS